jgi:hypothetical protein
MGIVITPFCEQHVEAVRAFNARLRAGGIAMPFPESHVCDEFPKVDGRSVYNEFFLGVDDGTVRGAYILKQQPFYINGQIQQLGLFRLPISEGPIDKRFASLGVQMYLDALRRQPKLFTIGLGGYEEAFCQLLIKAGWNTWPVPFYFRVLRPARFLRNIVYLRTTLPRRLALDTLAGSGLGTLGVHAYQMVKAGRTRGPAPEVECTEEPAFGPWADGIWNAAKSGFSMIAVRDATILNILYPVREPRWTRLKVSSDGNVVGWAVVLNVLMEDHNYFGNMRVGSLIDGLSLPGMESAVAAAAVQYLQSQQADIVVANLSDRRWRTAAEAAGLYEGPSNYIFATSKTLSALLDPFEEKKHDVHMTRGDGVGAHNLITARP